jgi:hypothetical protein
MPAIFELVVLARRLNVRAMGFWISAVIALFLAALGAAPVERLHGLDLPSPETPALLAAAFALAGLLSRGRRGGRVTD